MKDGHLSIITALGLVRERRPSGPAGIDVCLVAKMSKRR
jgi:hypothetical protein